MRNFTIITIIFGWLTANAQINLPYYNNFETDTAGWYTELSTGSAWGWAAPVGGSCTGTLMLGAGFNNPPISPGLFYSPVFDVTGVGDLMLCMTHRYMMLSGYEGVRIEFSYDNGPWNILGAVGQGSNWYNEPAVVTSGLPGWSGNSAGCLNSSISIDPAFGYSTLQLRFIFTVNPGQIGLFVFDDFSLCVPTCACTGTVGTDMPELFSTFSFSPNPVIDAVEWQLNYLEGSSVRLEITDLAGRQVMLLYEGSKSGLHTSSTDISDLSPGLYMFRLSGAGQSVYRLVKM